MDGDCADLIKLIQIKKKYDALLYVDEAHAVGVRGKKGLGLSEESGVIQNIDMIVCTLGKAIASEGAFIICDGELKEFLVNHARTLIFTTAMSPIQIRWTRFIFEKIITMEKERLHLQDLSNSFRRALQDRRILGNTHIIPLLVGESTDCLRLSEKFKEKGIWAMAVRYPTVPVDKARIRFSLTAGFTKEQIKEAYEIVLEN
jgi:8-amino-7-oxononanoate synthase